MDIRYPANPQDFETYTTERIRAEFLIFDDMDAVDLTRVK